MVVRIRLARFGKRHAPVYNIVVAQARSARNSKPLEVLGTYDPIAKIPSGGEGRPFKDIQLDTARAKYWLGVGAQPSDTAWRLLAMAGLMEPKYRPDGMKVLGGNILANRRFENDVSTAAAEGEGSNTATETSETDAAPTSTIPDAGTTKEGNP